MSPPVWGATVCSSPWGSPAAPPLLSGWISLKRVGCSKSFHAVGKGRLEYLSLDWLCCLLPQAAPSLSCSLHDTYRSCQPCFCSPTSPRGADWAVFHQVLLWLYPYKIQASLIAGKTPQKSSLIPLVLQLLPLSLLCFSITHKAPSPSPWPGP